MKTETAVMSPRTNYENVGIRSGHRDGGKGTDWNDTKDLKPI